jgi:2-oxoglutarate ferredoxin oxidoreductase subunit alpha
MAQPQTSVLPEAPVAREPAVNRLTIQVATVNGSGSQTANNTILRSIFQMGVPVSGKNLFPSNIAGLPTWFTIRADADGYVARKREVDVLVCMNPATAEADVKKVPAGAVAIYDDTIRIERVRTDVHLVPVPFQTLVREVCPAVALRRLVVNMIYVGVLAELLGIEVAEIERALAKAFAAKPKALGVNRDAVNAGVAWAKENLKVRSSVRVARLDKNAGKILVDGNTACAVGALFAGVTVLTWYPITPSSSLAEMVTELAEKYRRDPATGRSTCAIVQAEDELAAIGMVIGAGWAGARALTTTSGPGISLMAEFAGLAYYAEIPAVVVDVQRTGPSTGLPTRTMQGDVLKAAFLSHGDAMHPCLYPSSIEEAYRFTYEAFDLAERLQTLVFVMTDLDLGMNLWMSEPFPYPDEAYDRGKVLTAEQLKTVEGWGRYKDVDGDGIPYRTLPGTPGGLGAYFTRGSGHDEHAGYTEDGATYARNMDRLLRKLDGARALLPEPVAEAARPGQTARVGILAFGTTHHAIVECRDQLLAEHGLATDYLRVRAFPFHASVGPWIAAHERVYVVEQNRDAQMLRMLRAEYPEHAARLRSVRHYDGLPIDARSVTEDVVEQEGAGDLRAAAAKGRTA